MSRIQDHQETFDELVEKNLTPPRLDAGAALCGVLGLMLLMVMLLISTSVLPVYEWSG